VSTYEVTLKDRTVEVIDGADAYQQEGQMTTFFSTAAGRQVVDCWSSRLASFRTSEIIIVRRVQRTLPPLDAVDAARATSEPAAASDDVVRLRSA
jgi:hypothetical protein